MSGKSLDVDRNFRPSGQRNLVSFYLALLLIVTAVVLEYSNTYRREHYPIGTGVQYPYWFEFHPSWKREVLEERVDQCRDEAQKDVSCALFSKFGSGEQSANEVAVVGRATSEDRSGNYCDRFFGACAKQTTNVTLADASDIFDYLELAYLDPARENVERGRMAQAYAEIKRIGYLLGPIDLPLGSEHCCRSANSHFIVAAFLGEKARWKSRDYVQAVLALPDSSREVFSDEDRAAQARTDKYPDTAAYARGVIANSQKCFRFATKEFSQLAQSDERRSVRELAAYMALLSRFRGQLYSNESCIKTREGPPPPDLSAAEVAQLKAQIKRQSFLTDIQQIEAARTGSGTTHAA